MTEKVRLVMSRSGQRYVVSSDTGLRVVSYIRRSTFRQASTTLADQSATSDHWRTDHVKTAAIYARIAHVVQGEGASMIEGQLRLLRAYCRGQGWAVVAEYTDLGESGIKENRPEFQRMVSDAERGVFNLVVVADFSRFFRDAFLGELYRRRLRDAGVELVCAGERESASDR